MFAGGITAQELSTLTQSQIQAVNATSITLIPSDIIGVGTFEYVILKRAVGKSNDTRATIQDEIDIDP